MMFAKGITTRRPRFTRARSRKSTAVSELEGSLGWVPPMTSTVPPGSLPA
jgi:hypothetical protein